MLVEVSGFKCVPKDIGWTCTLYEKGLALKPNAYALDQQGKLYPKADVEHLHFENIDIDVEPNHTITAPFLVDTFCDFDGDTLTCETEKEIPLQAQEDDEDDED